MKANEFVKEYGIDIARECLEERPKTWEDCYLKLSNFELVKYIPSPLDFIDVDDLKRLIESHELVEKYKNKHGGIRFRIRWGMYRYGDTQQFNDRLKQAIEDVESCQ